jgi:hypothetical protein
MVIQNKYLGKKLRLRGDLCNVVRVAPRGMEGTGETTLGGRIGLESLGRGDTAVMGRFWGMDWAGVSGRSTHPTDAPRSCLNPLPRGLESVLKARGIRLKLDLRVL